MRNLLIDQSYDFYEMIGLSLIGFVNQSHRTDVLKINSITISRWYVLSMSVINVSLFINVEPEAFLDRR